MFCLSEPLSVTQIHQTTAEAFSCRSITHIVFLTKFYRAASLHTKSQSSHLPLVSLSFQQQPSALSSLSQTHTAPLFPVLSLPSFSRLQNSSVEAFKGLLIPLILALRWHQCLPRFIISHGQTLSLVNTATVSRGSVYGTSWHERLELPASIWHCRLLRHDSHSTHFPCQTEISISLLFLSFVAFRPSISPVFRFFALHGFMFTHVYVHPNNNMSAQTINVRDKNTDNTRPFIQEILGAISSG